MGLHGRAEMREEFAANAAWGGNGGERTTPEDRLEGPVRLPELGGGSVWLRPYQVKSSCG